MRLKITAQHAPPQSWPSGFTLLEVLVTLVVVSIGLLGLLGLQTTSLNNALIASWRTQATILAGNFAARMQANPEADYTGIATGKGGGNSLPDCNQNPCDKAEIRKRAVWIWHRNLQDRLPGGYGFVDCVNGGSTASAPCDSYRITVAWREHGRPTANGSAQIVGSPDMCADDPPGRNVTDRCFVTLVRP